MSLGEGKGRTQLNGFRVFRFPFFRTLVKAGAWELWQAGAAPVFLSLIDRCACCVQRQMQSIFSLSLARYISPRIL